MRDEDRQTLVGAVLRVLAPLDGSGWLAARSRSFRTPPFAVAPDASRPCSMPLASLGAPLQSFPFPGSRTRSRGPLLTCGFVLRLPPAQRLRGLRDRFHPGSEPTLCRSRPPGGGPGTHEPGRGIPAIVSPVASTHRSAPHVPSTPHQRWARRLTAGTPASELCSPRESVPRHPRNLARPKEPVGALLGFSPSRALSTTVLGSVSRVDMHGGRSPFPRTSPGAQPSRLHAATRTPTPGLASPGSVDPPRL
jgi:hypothetical protein